VGARPVHVRAVKGERNLFSRNEADIAVHRDGFRRSDRYEAWCILLHGFYDPMAAVTYFEEAIP
jgi:hypothetical protein